MVNNGIKVERAGTIGLEILDELIGANQREEYVDAKGVTRRRDKKKYKEINGVNVKLSSERYPVFQSSVVCVHCGLVGSFFGIERTDKSHTDNYHLNLYGINADGEEVLFTKDHIIPRSKGGKNAQYNYQTMCVECNGKKGSEIKEIELTQEQRANWLRMQIKYKNNGDYENVPSEWMEDQNIPKTNLDIVSKKFNH